MKSRITRLLCASVLSLGLATGAQAALVSRGAEAGTSVADCPSFCTNFNFGPSLGGQNVIDSGISAISETRGNADARASLTGDFNTPVLQGRSAANPSFKGGFASAFGVQGYTYNGPGEVLTLDVALDGLVVDPEFDASDTRARLEVVFYATNPFEFLSRRGTLDFEIGATPLAQSGGGGEASTLLQLDHTNPTHAGGQISVDATTGDQFYLWALLTVRAESGSAATSVNAFNTATMSFPGSPVLVAASSVPLPGAVWLFGVGVAGLLARARRIA